MGLYCIGGEYPYSPWYDINYFNNNNHTLSPELVQNENYNEKADVWAAGCILYEMAALKSPFHSHNGNILLLATKVSTPYLLVGTILNLPTGVEI